MPTALHAAIAATLQLVDLRPSPHVNQTMQQLVQAVIDTPTPHTQDLPLAVNASQLRAISGQAETELEHYWAQQILASTEPSRALLSFPYLHNYQDLTRWELQLAQQTGLEMTDINHILVVGSGSLPLSAYQLQQQANARVDQVDNSPEAAQIGRSLSRQLAIPGATYCADGSEVALEGAYDLILLAALAGSNTASKQSIIDNLLPHLATHGRLIVRSAAGTRRLLYPPVEPSELAGVTLLASHHPEDDIINSILIFQKELV